MYLALAPCIKISFLLFYDRVFGNNRTMKWFIWAGIGANAIFYIIIFFKALFLCNPIQASFNPAVHGHCGEKKTLPYVTGIWGFLSDFYIFFLPLPMIWGLNMKTERKLKLMLAFSVGLLYVASLPSFFHLLTKILTSACIASIIRFAFTIILVNDKDVTWNYIQLSLWAYVLLFPKDTLFHQSVHYYVLIYGVHSAFWRLM
jgi:hypothetical protein